MRAVSRVAAALVAALLLGCDGGAGWPNDVVLTSAHFRYHARAGDPLCPGLLDRLEANLRAVTPVLGIDSADIVVDYYKYRNVDDVHANGPCPNGWHSCANGSTIHTGVAQAFQHELIHGYVAGVGSPDNVYQEGLAEMFNCTSMAGSSPPGVSWRDVAAKASAAPPAEPDAIGDTAYYAASTFLVRSLIDRFGVASFMRFYGGGSTHRATVDQFAAEFEAAFGESIETAWTAAQTPSTAFGWPYLCPCGGAESFGAVTSFDETCPTGLPAVFPVAVAGAGARALTVAGRGANVAFRSCDGVVGSPALWMATDDYLLPQERSGLALLTELSQGTYFVAAMGGAGMFTLKESTWLGADCATVTELRLGQDIPRDYKLWISIPGDRRAWVRLATAEPVTQALPGMVQYCAGCDVGDAGSMCISPQSTTDVIPAGSYPVPINPTGTARFHTVGVQYDLLP